MQQFDEKTGVELVDQDLLRKYITYAKANIKPTLKNLPQDKVAKMYSELRRESMVSI